MRAKHPIRPDTRYEQAAFTEGYTTVIGLDEAGRGAWAGPVSAGAVCLTQSPDALEALAAALPDVTDSKLLTARQRAALRESITGAVCAWGVGSASSAEIDAVGIVPATKLAMQRALEAMLPLTADCLLLDTLRWDEYARTVKRVSIVRGDQQSLSIAAASILAKTWRDEYMRAAAELYPQHGFAAHKGYGTPAHRQALKAHGVTPEHRRSFAPIRLLLTQRELL